MAFLSNIMFDHVEITTRRTYIRMPDRFISALPYMVFSASKNGYKNMLFDPGKTTFPKIHARDRLEGDANP